MIIIGPLWILNSILFLFHFFLLVFFLLYTSVTDIKIQWQNKNIKEIELLKSHPVDFNFIQTKDILLTKVPLIQKKKVYTYKPVPLINYITTPQIPDPLPVKETVILNKELLPPLQIALHGTLITENPMHNKVFIENINSKQEKEYGIGDTIEDAQIIFINKNKVIFVRSNGQEESIHLNKNFKIQEDKNNNLAWDNVIIYNANDNFYYLNINLFQNKIKSFAAFINEVGLTTAFSKNYPIGCTVQNVAPGSIAYALNIITGDIITKVNNIEINNSDNRLEVLNQIQNNIASNNVFDITLTILNNQQENNITIKCYQDSKDIKVKKIGFFNVYEEKNKERNNNEKNN